MAQKLDFARYKLTGASIQWLETGTYKPGELFGLIGSLNHEPEVRTIVIDAEGDEMDSIDIVQFLNVTVTGHIPIENYRKVFGLSNDGLKTGVYATNTRNIQGEGILTFELEDLYGRDELLMAYPNIRFSGGFTFAHENGGEEIAQLELTAKAYPDQLKHHYYEALKSEIEPADVTVWHTDFSTDLVSSGSIPGV